jgi:hypothetical protein
MSAILWIKEKKKAAFAFTGIGLPLLGGFLLFATIDFLQKNPDLFHSLFFGWLGILFSLITGILLLETFLYLIMTLLKEKESFTFPLSKNGELCAILLFGGFISFSVAWILSKSAVYGGAFFLSLGGIALVEGWSKTFLLTAQEIVSRKENFPAKKSQN